MTAAWIMLWAWASLMTLLVVKGEYMQQKTDDKIWRLESHIDSLEDRYSSDATERGYHEN